MMWSRLAAVLFALAIASGLNRASADIPVPQKVLRYAFPSAETGFDPAQISDLYSATIIANILDPLLTYDYLARPAKVVPNTADMPDVSPDGKIWTLHIHPGIYFSDDPAFHGKKRELTAADYVYSIERHFDPKNKSQQEYILDDYIVGMEEPYAKAKKTGHFDYDAPIKGLRALDRYTLRIELTKPKYNLLYDLTYCSLVCAVAREVVETYGDRITEHPVGTNAYRLAYWRRSSLIVLEANPTFREAYFDGTPSPGDAVAQAIYDRLHGRRLPMVPRVEVSIIQEPQPRWLSFLNQEQDLLERVPTEFANLAVPNGELAPNLAKRGISMSRAMGIEITYTYFQMKDPIVGGYTPDKIALRRAICLGYDTDEEIRIVRNEQAIPAETPVPPGAAGYDPSFHSTATEFDPAKARALLDMFGYKVRDASSYRSMPDGSPLVLDRASTPTQLDKPLDELWKKDMAAIGIRVSIHKAQWPELLKQSKAGQLMSWGVGWISAIPDAESFYVLLYGPYSGQTNHGNFDQPEFNALFARALVLPDGPERNDIYREMNRLIAVYAPWKLGVDRIVTDLSQPWLIGYTRHPVLREFWKYVDIDVTQQQAVMR